MPHKTRRLHRNGNRKRKGGERQNNFIIAENVSHESPRQINISKKQFAPYIVRKTLGHVPKPVKVQYYNAYNVQPQYATYMPYSPPLEITQAVPHQQNTVQIVSPIQAKQAQVAQSYGPQMIQPMQIAKREFIQPIFPTKSNQITIKPKLGRSLGTRKLLRRRK